MMAALSKVMMGFWASAALSIVTFILSIGACTAGLGTEIFACESTTPPSWLLWWLGTSAAGTLSCLIPWALIIVFSEL